MTKPPLTAIGFAALLTVNLGACSGSRPSAGSVSCAALGLVAGDSRLADLARPTQETIAGNNVAIVRNCPGRSLPGVDVNALWGRR